MATCTAFQKKERLKSTLGTTTHAGKKSEQQFRSDIVRFAKKYEGTDYKYAGKSPDGFDCSGFTHFVLKKFGIDLPSVSRSQEDKGKKIELKEARPGDLVFFRRTKKGNVFHVGLVVSNNAKGITMIHSSSTRGIVIDNINENRYWNSKIASTRNVLNE